MIRALKAGSAPILRRFRHDESGATAIEYCLIASFIALTIVTVLTQVGINLQAPFQTASDGLT
jgi:pilus assembly protein Flp/PilA